MCWGPVDRRDDIYAKTRLRTPSKDHMERNARIQPTASSVAIQAQVAPTLGAPVSSRTLRRRLAEGHLGSRHPLRVFPLMPTHRRLRLEWCHARSNWTATEWIQLVFSDKSGFNLSSDNNRVRVYRPRGERFNPAFALQRHYSHSWCNGMGYHCQQYTVILSIDP
ncbi:transposable element Tcb2 transposase [Trichonephila clavipes]|nr:transposable element Tcb2 transposase [Trichonephila clavipes]